MARSYEEVARIASRSSPGKFYEIKRDRESGELSCNCPAWTRRVQSDGSRTCKHLDEVRRQSASLNLQVERVPRPAARGNLTVERRFRAEDQAGTAYYIVRIDRITRKRVCECGQFATDGRTCRHIQVLENMDRYGSSRPFPPGTPEPEWYRRMRLLESGHIVEEEPQRDMFEPERKQPVEVEPGPRKRRRVLDIDTDF